MPQKDHFRLFPIKIGWLLDSLYYLWKKFNFFSPLESNGHWIFHSLRRIRWHHLNFFIAWKKNLFLSHQKAIQFSTQEKENYMAVWFSLLFKFFF
jgi:hypothetical protein